MRTIIGIDVSKDTASVAVATDLVIKDNFKIDLDLIGLNRLKTEIDLHDKTELVFEATGMYSRRLVTFLERNGYEYHILNPLEAKNRIATGTRLRKNDTNDSKRLAITEFTEHLTPFLMAYKQNPVYRELNDMSRFYDQILEDLKRARNRSHRVIQLTFASFKDEFDFDTKGAWQMMSLFPHADIVKQYDLTELEQMILAANFKGIGSYRAKQYARKLFRVAAVTATAVDASSDAVRQVKWHANAVLTFLNEQEQQVKRMGILAEQLPEYLILQSIPGIGKNIAVRLIGELGDVRRFNTRGQLNSYVGLDLVQADSGDYQSPRKITKHGNSHARHILYWSIVLAIGSKTPNHIKDIYQKRLQPGSYKKKVIVLCIDRLLKTILHLVKTNQTYSYEIATRK